MTNRAYAAPLGATSSTEPSRDSVIRCLVACASAVACANCTRVASKGGDGDDGRHGKVPWPATLATESTRIRGQGACEVRLCRSTPDPRVRVVSTCPTSIRQHMSCCRRTCGWFPQRNSIHDCVSAPCVTFQWCREFECLLRVSLKTKLAKSSKQYYTSICYTFCQILFPIMIYSSVIKIPIAMVHTLATPSRRNTRTLQ